MTGDNPSEIVLRGAKVWNAWREQFRGAPHFAKPRWYDSPGRGGRQVKGRNRVDFSGMNLSGVSVHGAFAEGLNLRNAVFNNAHFEEGDFSRADFSGATFHSTRFTNACKARVTGR